MRLCERDKWMVYIKAQASQRSATGAVTAAYSSDYVEIRAAIQPLSSKLSAEMYGFKANEMLLMLYSGNATINIADGVCVYAVAGDQPDYKVVSKKPWGSHTEFELEKVTR